MIVLFSVLVLLISGTVSTIIASGDSLGLKTPIAILCYSVLFALAVSSLMRMKKSILQDSIATVIYIHATFVFLQFTAWYIFNLHFDFIAPVTGEASRNFGGYIFGTIFYRSSGLFVEPGTCASYLAILLLIYILLRGRSLWVRLCGYTSIVLTFSAQGVLLVFLVSAIDFVASDYYARSRRLGVYLSVVFVVGVVSYISLYQRFFGQGELVDSSLSARLSAFALLSDAPLMGYGFSTAPLLGTGNTLFLYLYSYMGIFSAIVIALLIPLVFRSPLTLLSVLVLFSTKIVPTSPFFWLSLYLILATWKEKSRAPIENLPE